TTRTSAIAAAIRGFVMASQVRPIADASSPSDSPIFENGSGLALAAALVVAFAPCAVNATPPDTRAAITCHTGSMLPSAPTAITAAAAGLMNVWTVSQRLSRYG